MSRSDRINDEIMREAALIVRGEIKDPRVSSLTTVTGAEATADLKQCKIFVSIMGDEPQKKEVMEGLKNASGFVRKLLAQRINLRNTPEIKFVLDDSIEHSMHMESIMRKIKEDEGRG